MGDPGSLELLVFLGNAGAQYARTRHNVGWMVLDHESFSAASGWQQKFKARWTRLRHTGASSTANTPVLLRPETMMNRSGESVRAAARFFRIRATSIVVVHDDVELPFGSIAFRRGGGLAGHNGLRSIVSTIGTRDFWRLRLGIGRPAHGALHGHVLGRFSDDEMARLPQILSAAALMLLDMVASGPQEQRAKNVLHH